MSRKKTAKGSKASKHRTSSGRTAAKAKSQPRKSSGVRQSPNAAPARRQEKLLADATRELMSLGSNAFASLE